MLFNPILRIDNNNAPIKALRKLSTSNPGVIKPAKLNKKAFITKVNNPKVKILIGKVTKTKTGFIKTLIIAMIIATTNAFQNPSTDIPGTTHAINNITRAKAIQRKNKYSS